MSSPPLPEFVEEIKRKSPLTKNEASPSSPTTVLRPLRRVIRSFPAPPMTVFVPDTSVIVSAAPPANAVLSILSSSPVFASVMIPLSPSTIPRASGVVPVTVMESDFAPPATTLYPDPTVTRSMPPTNPFRLEITVVPVGTPPLVSTSRRPSSASTKLRPVPTITVSLPAPAITLLTPLLSVIVSFPPTPRLIDSIRRKSPFAKNEALPSSPRIVFVPFPAVI